MPRFDEVGQEPDSVDCGWFCGYVLGLNRRHDGRVHQMLMTQDEVYAAREDYLGHRGASRSIAPSRHWLHPGQAPVYLGQRSVDGYGTRHVTLNMGNFEAVIGGFLRHPACYGLMLPLIGTAGPDGVVPGHWIAILGPMGSNWVVYDPSGLNPAGTHIPPFADDLPPAVIAGYARNAVPSIVRPV
jgi:hypothetical protein